MSPMNSNLPYGNSYFDPTTGYWYVTTIAGSSNTSYGTLTTTAYNYPPPDKCSHKPYVLPYPPTDKVISGMVKCKLGIHTTILGVESYSTHQDCPLCGGRTLKEEAGAYCVYCGQWVEEDKEYDNILKSLHLDSRQKVIVPNMQEVGKYGKR